MGFWSVLTRFLAIGWAHLYMVSVRWLHYRLPGLGFWLRRIPDGFVFSVHQRFYYFHPPCASAYRVLVAGYSNEPETIKFLGEVFSRLPSGDECTFVDAGASIGEMVIFAAGFPQVREVFAFEPQTEACEAIRRSAMLNGFDKVRVCPWALSDKAGQVPFFTTVRNPTNAHIASAGTPDTIDVPCRRLDETVAGVVGLAVLLIDVEGAELKVIQGARDFVRRCAPLIIFEYHGKTRKQFTLNDVAAELGPAYSFYRLRCNGDGRLDRNLEDTWNIVAVPQQSIFKDICNTQMIT